ncbi:MAG TPA: hypothetical protein VIH88_03755 [Candidatus Acidoferrales bacterium]
MNTKNIVLNGALAAVLVCAGIAVAQAPSENIDPHKYGNLADAQHHIVQAYQKIEEAQRANKDDLGGHAQKAQQLLSDADRELKAAAEFAEHRK